MSRIGKAPITIPAGVDVSIGENNHVTIKGPKGTLERKFAPQLSIALNEGVLTVARPDDEKQNRALHGLTRSLLNDMVIGVNEGFKKELQVQGVGYRVAKEGKKLVMNIGFSHTVVVEDTDDVSTECPNANTIIVSGIDKQKVGQFAADVRKKRPPEPYKGKGIRYANEVVRHKEGKTGAK
ncbi:MAG: 50S ribosomal protein L6 [Clostridiales bacterium]|jgi:large subunit ribosomal protein L6|nr:50S ribosomal protein L6 [Clostridiales bacterium]